MAINVPHSAGDPGHVEDHNAIQAALQGVPIVRAFPFAFNTPNILTGHTVYTPTVADVLLDAWIAVGTPWDGITPLADFGFFDIPRGFLGDIGDGPVAVDVRYHTAGDRLNAGQPDFPVASTYVHLPITAPAVFLTADPLKVVVSQDGTNVGADPGSTTGDAVLYLVTATPRVG